jgi:shikimate kinase
MDKHIYLCGFMGSGKTTIGRLLAKRINRRFVDTDEEIEKIQLRSITEIFEQSGEPEFRRIEKELIRKIALEKEPAVIALGGGSMMGLDEQRIVKESGILIYLQCSNHVLLQRIRNTLRPLLKTESFESLLNKRLPGYLIADYIIDNDSIKIDYTLKSIIAYLKIK